MYNISCSAMWSSASVPGLDKIINPIIYAVLIEIRSFLYLAYFYQIQIFFTQNFCIPNLFLAPNFFDWMFFIQIILKPKFFLYVCMYLSLHPLGWAHSFWRLLEPKMGLHFFEFELKPTGKDSADPTQHKFQHHIV